LHSPDDRFTVRVMADPLTEYEPTETRITLRQLMRCPPLRPDDAEKVLRRLAMGEGITSVGDVPGMPAYWVINLWRREYPEFDELCVAASEAGADALAWENVEIADDDRRSPANKALSIQVREKLSKVLNRKKYDPAVKVELSGNARAADELSDAELAAIARRSARVGAVDAVIVAPSDGGGDGSGNGDERTG
jgi:hypothetical protein